MKPYVIAFLVIFSLSAISGVGDVTDPTTGSDRGYGTAFSVVFNNKVYVITNHHVCEFRYKKTLYAHAEVGDKWHKLTKIASFAKQDICILKSPTIKSGLRLSKVNAELKQDIRVIGHPRSGRLTISFGNVWIYTEVYIKNWLTKEECTKSYYRWQTFRFFGMKYSHCVEVRESYGIDALVMPGSSGSPVLDNYNRVMGVIYAGSMGDGYFMGVEHIREVLAYVWMKALPKSRGPSLSDGNAKKDPSYSDQNLSKG